MDEGANFLKSFCGLSDEQYATIDAVVQEKILISFENLKHDLSVSQAALEDEQSLSGGLTDKHAHEIERLSAEYNSVKDKVLQYEKNVEDINIKYKNALEEKGQMREKLNDVLSVNTEIEMSIKNLKNDNDILTEQLKHKIEVINELSEEVKSYKSERESVRKMKMEALCKMEEVTSLEAQLKAQDLRWENESSSIRRHNVWLEERLKQTTDQLLTIRKDMMQKVNTLEAEVDLKKNELSNSMKTIQSLESSVEKLKKANEDYINKLKQVAEEQIRLEQLYGNELDAQKQLVNLYKIQSNETEDKNEQLMKAAESMQSLLKEAYENVSHLESDNETMRQLLSDEQAKSKEIMERLSSELQQSRDLLDKFRVDGLSEEELRQLNPAVTATLSALKRGHSLTQLYSDYLQVVEDRDQLKLDKYRLTEYVKQLVDDVKEKAPVLRDQKERFERFQTQVKELSLQLKASENKLEEAQCKLQETQRRASYYQRETGRLKLTCGDLSKQVQHLLREMELLRGTVIDDTLDMNTSQSVSTCQLPDSSTLTAGDLSQLVNSLAPSSASIVIDEHLVTWSNLRDLQCQNQRLLCVARDLAGQLEKHERAETETESRVEELSTRLESLSGELEVVRLVAKEAKNEAHLARRQRDAYRAILERYDLDIAESKESELDISTEDVPAGSSKTAAAMSTATIERLEESLKSLETEFKRYRDDKVESDAIYSTTVDNLRKEASEARLLNQKLAAQLDFTHEKLRTMEANVSGYKQEITILREMNARYSTSAATSEAEIIRLHQELTRTSDKLLTVEVDSHHATRQLEVARANESRWRQEIEALRKQEQMHSRLMHQLEAIQGNLEQRDSLERSNNERRIRQLETQLAEAQAAFVEASQAGKNTRATLEHELAVMAEKVQSSDTEIKGLQQKLAAAEETLKNIQSKAGSVDELGPSSSRSAADSEQAHTFDMADERLDELRQAQHEVDSLRSRLASAKQQADQMKELAEAAENRVLEAIEENQQAEERMSSRLDELQQRCGFLEAQLDLEKKERQNLVNENIRIAEEAHQMNAKLRRELATAESELVETKTRCEAALHLEAGAKGEIEAHGRVAQEARDKYERELALHAEDVEALTTARSSLESVSTQLREAKEALRNAQAEAANAKTQLDRETSGWETTKDELNDRLLQADKTQTSLQEQIIKLTQQLVSLRKVMETSNKSSGAASSSTDGVSADCDDLKTSEDLLQLVSYIRRQKSIAEAACDAQSAEVSRLILRVSSLETEVSHLTDQLEAERKTNEMATESASRHSELMESLQQLNLVTESNCLLRHERETLRSKCQHLEEQLRSLEDSVEPLRNETEQLKGTVSMLTLEGQSLEEERNRWKERCNRLVETAQRLDPEQYRSVCNERDDLQRHLRKVEEDFQQQVVKNSELEQTIQSRDEEVKTAQKALTDVQQASSDFSARCDSLRRELETKDTFVVKLREIGRKYRQEAETLRRQAQASRSDEAQLQSVSEALTEARADVFTLRDELASVRSEFTRLEITVNECLQLVDEFGLEEAVEASPTTHPLVSALRSIVAAHSGLRCKADSQHERLLRMQLIESQLTKSLRDCSELRQRLTEMQSVSASPASASSPTQTVTVSQSSSYPARTTFTGAPGFPPTTAPTEAGEVVDLSTSQRLLESDSSNSSSGAAAAVVVPVQQQPITSDQCPAASTPAGTSQSVPAWILRAASSAIQSVPPTPAVTPPMACSAAATSGNSVCVGVVGGQTSSVKQMAEIKPITSNVATVMPTLILSQPTLVAFTSSAVSPNGSSSLVSMPPVTNIAAAAVPGGAGGATPSSLAGSSLGELSYLAATATRSVINFRQTSAESVASQSLPLFPSTSTMNVTGKRRLEETVVPVSAIDSGSLGQMMPTTHFPATSLTGVSDAKRFCQQQRQQVPVGCRAFLVPSIGTGLFGSPTPPADSQNSPVAASALIESMPTAMEILQPANEEGQSSAFFSPVPSIARDPVTPATGNASTACSPTATNDGRLNSPQHRPPVEATLRQPSTSCSPSTFAQDESLATTPEPNSRHGKPGLPGDDLPGQMSPVQQEQEQGFGDCLDPVEDAPVDEGSSCSDLDEEAVAKGFDEGEEDNGEEDDDEEEEEEDVEEGGEEGDIGDVSFIEGVGEEDEEEVDVDVRDDEGRADDVIELSSDSGDSEDDEEPGLPYSVAEAEGEEDSECANETAVEAEDEHNSVSPEDENEDFTNLEDPLEDVDEVNADDDDDVPRMQQCQAEVEGAVFEGEDEGDTADTDLIAEYVETGPEESVEQSMCSDQETDIKSEHQVEEGDRDGEMAFDKTRQPEQPAYSTATSTSSSSSSLFSFRPATKSVTFGGLFGSAVKPSASAAGLFALQPPTLMSTGTSGTIGLGGTGFFHSNVFSPQSTSSSSGAASTATTTSVAGFAISTPVEMDQQPTATQSPASFRSSILKPASSVTPTGSGGVMIQSEPIRPSGSLLGDPVRPKIQPIVWDETVRKSGTEVGQACSSHQAVVPLIGKPRTTTGSMSPGRRKKWGPSGCLSAGRSSGISRPTHASTLPAARHDPFGGGDAGAGGGGGSGGTAAGPSTSMRPHGSHPRRL